jgi:hypothetical protein
MKKRLNKIIRYSRTPDASLGSWARAPFPYFGGKYPIADKIWGALGDVKHYIEPCFGSGAVLLARPNWNPQIHIETVNDADGYICNVWRAIKFSPDETARWCDWPVNYADLMARKSVLIQNESRLLENLIRDDMWHDPKMAGYWIWAASCSIAYRLTRSSQRPHIGHGGMGIHKMSQRSRDNSGMGINKNIYKWFRQLSNRLRYVRVVCGDWTGVCGGDWQDDTGMVGIFFDPPYGEKANRAIVYHNDSLSIADDIRNWCLERGDRKTYRIVLSGYFEEHLELLNRGWRYERWSAQGGYSNMGKEKKQGDKNRHRETLFFSPYCISQNLPLFISAHKKRTGVKKISGIKVKVAS